MKEYLGIREMSEMWSYSTGWRDVPGITPDRKCELCRKNGSAEAVYYIEGKGIREQIVHRKRVGDPERK